MQRYYRRGGPLPQLCRTEWVFLPPAVVVRANPQGQPPPGPEASEEARRTRAPSERTTP